MIGNETLSSVMSELGSRTSDKKAKTSAKNGAEGCHSQMKKVHFFESVFPHKLTNNEWIYKHVIGKTKTGRDRTYNPDYYCPELSCYVECATSLGNVSDSAPTWRLAIEKDLLLRIYWWEGHEITNIVLENKTYVNYRVSIEKIIGHSAKTKPT
jgi:hypothetical protein